MFICFCKKKFSKRKMFIKHLKDHKILKQFSFPTFCHQPNCLSGNTFQSFYTLNKHLKNKHSCHNEHLVVDDDPDEYIENENHEFIGNLSSENNLNRNLNNDYNLSENKADFFLTKIKKQISEMIISFKSKSVLSETLFNEIIEKFLQLWSIQ